MAALPKGRVSARGLPSTMDFLKIRGFLMVLMITATGATKKDPTETYDMLHRSGVEAYNAGRWFECAKHMSAAIDDYKLYHTVLIDCRLKCQQESETDIDHNMFLELAFFDKQLKASDCLRRCKKEHLGSRPEVVNEKVEHDFKNLEPYNYLQLCAYKIENYDVAVSAAFTYLMAHPDHPQMKNNMQFYKAMPQVKPEYYVNLEAKDYQNHYGDGVDYYADEDYAETVTSMEEALRLFYEEARRCEALCEGSYDHESLPDHVNAMADHYIGVLECRAECPGKLATFMGKEVERYLQEHYNYLQYSYYKVGEVKKACEAAATYLMFDPLNAEMINNKVFFLGEEGVTEDLFVPRQDARLYYERQKHQQAQLDFVKKSYMFSDGDLDRNGLQRRRVRRYEPRFTPLQFGPQDDAYRQRLEQHLVGDINITLEEDDLQGEHRVVVDNFITKGDADKLVTLAGMAAQGDGYEGTEDRSSPHTDYEKFEGLTVMRAARLAKHGVISEDLVELYLSVSEKMRHFLEVYWNLVTPLYFHFTHLVCRTALQGKNGEKEKRDEEDLSHPVHSDNCNILPDGSCPKLPPAYVQRDVSAILYLNEGFEGGHFFFAHTNLSVQQKVEPKTSRMVAFEAGDFHGVQAVKRGRRCALALWFTMSEADAEKAHREAAAILRHRSVMEKMSNPVLRSMLVDEDIRVVKTEVELNGPERFAADQMVTKKECEILIKLANEGGQVGDGYSKTRTKSSLSPHTEHEKFAALTVKTAAELAAEGKVGIEDVELYLNIAEKGRKLVETYFNLKTKLYFDFTHLVCRTAIQNDNLERTDLSHPVHSDNCILQPDGSCKREAPAYVQRDYSAIIYLNSEFKGGEFFFTHSNLTIQAALKPHRGMLVGFNAGNYHGVKAVEAGQRCAIAMWYTLNPKFNEKAHLIARKIMKELKSKKKQKKDEL